jgi:SAM-dependent methyltransferase
MADEPLRGADSDSDAGTPVRLHQLTEHARRNQTEWAEWSKDYVEPGRQAWASNEIRWGTWQVLERDLRVLPDVEDRDVLELGCGTAYWSAWLTRLGARATGLDVTEAQLETARRFQREFGLQFPLVQGSAEALPFRDETFDVVFSEYGASIWCDPYLWVPEAARVLRRGGRLLFLVNGTIAVLCMPDDEEGIEPAGTALLRDYFGLHRLEWASVDSVNFFLGYGDWIRLLKRHGFEIEDLVEVRAPEGAPPSRPNVTTPEWARRWPSEEIWKAVKR